MSFLSGFFNSQKEDARKQEERTGLRLYLDNILTKKGAEHYESAVKNLNDHELETLALDTKMTADEMQASLLENAKKLKKVDAIVP